MTTRIRGKQLWAIGAVLVLLASFAVAALSPALLQGGGIVIGTNVVFRPSEGWADISFSSEQRFLNQVEVRPTGVTFDGIAFDVQKLPAELPRANVTISDWLPGAGNGATAIRLIASSEAGSTVWFNVSGLRLDALYQVYVDGAWRATSQSMGSLSFSWSDWSLHEFRFIAQVDASAPVAVPGNDRAAVVGELLTFNGSASYDDIGIVRYAWDFGDGTTGDGQLVRHAYGAEGNYVVALTVWDATGKSGTAGVSVLVSMSPTIDRIPPASVFDLRAADVGMHHVLLEWTAPGDDGFDGQVASYDVRYSKSNPLNDTSFAGGTAAPAPLPGPVGTSELVNVTGLSADTVYWFAVRAADEVPNWSPTSNVVEVLTGFNASDTSALLQSPAVGGIWFSPSEAQLDIVFSKSMNRTSVEDSLTIAPNVTYAVEWQNDAHVRIYFEDSLAAEGTYRLTIEPDAADRLGIPIASGFTFQFAGVTMPAEGTNQAGLPLFLMVPLVIGIAGLLVGFTFVIVRLVRTERKIHTLQDIAITQARRIKDLVRSRRKGQVLQDFANAQAKQVKDIRGQLLPRRFGRSRSISRPGDRK